MLKFMSKGKLMVREEMDDMFIVDKKGRVYLIDPAVSCEFRRLDKMVRDRIKGEKKETMCIVSKDWKDPFEEDVCNCNMPRIIEPDTPEIDKEITRQGKICCEAERIEQTRKANAMLKAFKELIHFANSDEILVDDAIHYTNDIKRSKINDVLHITEAEIVNAVMYIHDLVPTYKIEKQGKKKESE